MKTQWPGFRRNPYQIRYSKSFGRIFLDKNDTVFNVQVFGFAVRKEGREAPRWVTALRLVAASNILAFKSRAECLTAQPLTLMLVEESGHIG